MSVRKTRFIKATVLVLYKWGEGFVGGDHNYIHDSVNKLLLVNKINDHSRSTAYPSHLTKQLNQGLFLPTFHLFV